MHLCAFLSTAVLFPVGTWRVLPRSWSLWNSVCQSSTRLRCDSLKTSLCSTACMRPELVCAEYCDIHTVFVILSASLVACRLQHLSSSVNSLTSTHRGSGMCNVSQLFPQFFRIFSLVALSPCVIGIIDVCGEFATVFLLLVTVVRYIPCREDLLRVCCFTEVWFLRPVALLCAVHEVMPLSWTFFVTFDVPVS